MDTAYVYDSKPWTEGSWDQLLAVLKEAEAGGWDFMGTAVVTEGGASETRLIFRRLTPAAFGLDYSAPR